MLTKYSNRRLRRWAFGYLLLLTIGLPMVWMIATQANTWRYNVMSVGCVMLFAILIEGWADS